jgi:DNA-binding CsgD family transcriptional regulator
MSLPLSPKQREVMIAYARLGSWSEVARVLGMPLQTIKNHSQEAYQRLGVTGAMGAMRVLGFVVLPGEDNPGICGWVGYCSKSIQHAGHHGGFRSFAKEGAVL